MSAEIKIVPAKKYMRMKYFPVHSNDEMVKKFEEETMRKTGNDFVECLVYSKDEAVIMTGTMTDQGKTNKVLLVFEHKGHGFVKFYIIELGHKGSRQSDGTL